MNTMIVRNLPSQTHLEIKRMARFQNLSMNQMAVRLLQEATKIAKQKEKIHQQQMEAFQRIDKLREEIKRKYGRQEDSIKLIHEMREERMKRYL